MGIANDRALKDFQQFVGRSQKAALRHALKGEEWRWFQGRLIDMAGVVAQMPTTYKSAGTGLEKIAYLHYFKGGCDWYIIEKDSDEDGEGQRQAFGMADLGVGEPEMGYIDIVELLANGVELDLHFEPKALSEIYLVA